jgi:hypothetical protein
MRPAGNAVTVWVGDPPEPRRLVTEAGSSAARVDEAQGKLNKEAIAAQAQADQLRGQPGSVCAQRHLGEAAPNVPCQPSTTTHRVAINTIATPKTA